MLTGKVGATPSRLAMARHPLHKGEGWARQHLKQSFVKAVVMRRVSLTGNPPNTTLPSGRTILQPKGWPEPRGYANGIMARGRIIVTGGVVGWDEKGIFAADFVAQVRQVLLNIRAILAEAGAGPEHLVRLTWYVTDMAVYRASLREIGAAYREVFGKTFPAMALVQVIALVEPAALVEIEATAVIPD
jgi:enamine deaminase RidA (YjgF/YER057c/UK114 family)